MTNPDKIKNIGERWDAAAAGFNAGFEFGVKGKNSPSSSQIFENIVGNNPDLEEDYLKAAVLGQQLALGEQDVISKE